MFSGNGWPIWPLKARARIAVPIDRLAGGNFGDSKAIGEGLHELIRSDQLSPRLEDSFGASIAAIGQSAAAYQIDVSTNRVMDKAGVDHLLGQTVDEY
jgi:hypothetical protein